MGDAEQRRAGQGGEHGPVAAQRGVDDPPEEQLLGERHGEAAEHHQADQRPPAAHGAVDEGLLRVCRVAGQVRPDERDPEGHHAHADAGGEPDEQPSAAGEAQAERGEGPDAHDECEPDRAEGGDADGGHREGHVRRPAGGAERDADRDAQRDVAEHRDGELGPAHLGAGPDGRGGAGFQGGHRWVILRSRWSTAAHGIQTSCPPAAGRVRPRVPPPVERGGGPVIHARTATYPSRRRRPRPAASACLLLAEGRRKCRTGCDGAGRCASTSRRAGRACLPAGVTPRGEPSHLLGGVRRSGWLCGAAGRV